MKEILDHLDISAPDGESWSGHSLRKGAATGAHSIEVSIPKICWMGGWSIQSGVVHDYIDPSCPSSAAAAVFYGWLRAGGWCPLTHARTADEEVLTLLHVPPPPRTTASCASLSPYSAMRTRPAARARAVRTARTPRPPP